MRVFTAIALPQDVKDRFKEIAKGRLPIPYVNTENFHITLNFLGDLDTDKFALAKKTWDALPDFKKVKIEFNKLVKFRQQIHMTVKDNPELKSFQFIMRKEFEKAGFRFSFASYYAYVTIGSLHMDRVMNRERKIDLFPHEELAQLSFTADKIVMFESKLLLHYHHYVPISEHALI